MHRLATALLAATVITCLGSPHPAAAQPSPSCERVTGELDAWNGSPSLRIQAGPHLIGIVSSPDHPLPPPIIKDVDFAHSVTGLFTVCKLGQAQPNGMIYAWLQRAQHLKFIPAP